MMDDYYGTESYGPPGPPKKDELGTPMFFRHQMTARGLMGSERAREMSRGTDAIVVWSRGEAGSEIFWHDVRYVPAVAFEQARHTNHNDEWWLIARDDVQRVLDFLTSIRLGGGETIAAICDAAIHLLETGAHKTGAVPADFQGGQRIGSVTITTPDGVLVESIGDDGTITFTRPPSSGGIQVSEDIPEDEGDDDD